MSKKEIKGRGKKQTKKRIRKKPNKKTRKKPNQKKDEDKKNFKCCPVSLLVLIEG